MYCIFCKDLVRGKRYTISLMIVGPLGRFYDQVGNRMTLCEAHKTQIENGQGYTKVDSVELKEVL